MRSLIDDVLIGKNAALLTPLRAAMAGSFIIGEARPNHDHRPGTAHARDISTVLLFFVPSLKKTR